MNNANSDNTSSKKEQADQSAQTDAADQVLWLDEAAKGLAQVANGQASDARQSLAAQQKRRAEEWRAFKQSCIASTGRLNGWEFNREEANER